MPSLTSQWTLQLKEMALRHGFMGVGISKAERLDAEAKQLETWISKGYHGEMSYMANHFEMRVDPTKLVPGAKSVVSLMYNYFPDETASKSFNPNEDDIPLESERMPDAGYQMPDAFQKQHMDTSKSSTNQKTFKISKYAYGEDYHKVVRKKLKLLVSELKEEIGDFHARVFVDSAPVMERDWAKRSGQGWIGKNTLLIHPKKGSYFFLAEIILDVEFEYDHPIRDHCGTCTKCIDACPTEAISPQGYILDGSKCISYLTIELKSNIPEAFRDKMEDWIFGCDICQDVCPWNRFSTPHHEPAFDMNESVKQLKNADWLELTSEIFDFVFEKSAMKRAGFQGLKRNIEFVQKKE